MENGSEKCELLIDGIEIHTVRKVQGILSEAKYNDYCKVLKAQGYSVCKSIRSNRIDISINKLEVIRV